jgi:hypothetical protein
MAKPPERRKKKRDLLSPFGALDRPSLPGAEAARQDQEKPLKWLLWLLLSSYALGLLLAALAFRH